MDKEKFEDFNILVGKASQQFGGSNLLPVIKKELLHYDLLFILEQARLLDKLTFQGGTSLRLCYGGVRFSEDLDFVGGKDFTASNFEDLKARIETYINERYGLPVYVKPISDKNNDKHDDAVRVKHWNITVTTDPGKRDLPTQKMKIQICNTPAYTRKPLTLNINYDFLPDGYGDILIMTESLDEIMADKLVALVDTTKYIRYRDIWDLRWMKQHGATINRKFIINKISDYHIDSNNYIKNLNNLIQSIDEIINGEDFHNEMLRFLPMEVLERTLLKKGFKEFLTDHTKELLEEVKTSFETKKKQSEFDI